MSCSITYDVNIEPQSFGDLSAPEIESSNVLSDPVVVFNMTLTTQAEVA